MATDYQAREMKSVFVDVTTQYLKLVLYQPYANRLNLFDQAGLVSIQVLGEPIITVD
jgi:centrosomal protein CEP104